MCRIAGIVEKNYHPESPEKMKAMLHSLRRGGPDDEGIYTFEGVTFGHRRLSILDLSNMGHQPMVSSDGNFCITYNGEVYNFREIRSELERKGYQFISNTDTEVILNAYQEWGTEAFSKLNGMFAFAIFDKIKNQVLFVRDSSGIKPLYYSLEEDRLIFSSEIRALKAYKPNWPAQPNWEVLFLAFGSLPFPFTSLDGVKMLQKGAFLKLSLNDFSFSISQFQKSKEDSKILKLEEAESRLRETLEKAVERNLISDAPIGVFLSGGIDSSLISLVADKLGSENLNTLSVTFKEATFDESKYQKIVLDRIQSKHSSICVDDQLFLENLDEVFEAMDQPTIDGVNSFFIAKSAREIGLKAVLSGLGGDEYFGGYSSFSRVKQLKYFKFLPKKQLGSILGSIKNSYKRISYLQLNNPTGDYLFLRGLFSLEEIAQLTGISEKEVLETIRQVRFECELDHKNEDYASFLESNIYMENQLLKDTDYMSMWHGLEVRVPFLDKELIELVQRISPSIKYKSNVSKFLLTHTFREILPTQVVNRKKMGFTFPFELWLKKHLNEVNEITSVNANLNTMRMEFEAGKVHWSKYWSLLVAQKFNA